MATSQSQHRCVFVGNIPYDATEEQLVQICEEVGPVVSFRLVIDRETGKPKGYGFCEYKDEETALSARRNLQGYEINGRQLRVDFAENDKNADRNREQGRGGPGMVTNVDTQKQFGGPAVPGDSSMHQPIGVSVAMAAAAAMAGVLGSAQTGSTLNQIGPQNQSTFGSDPLTLHLAKMSRSQLNAIISEMKALTMQNKEQMRQLLLGNANLPKALFQVQIMLGLVTPQMLQMPNIRQASASMPQPSWQDGQPAQPSAAQSLPGLPPLPQNRMQFGVLPQASHSQVSAGPPNSSIQFSPQPQVQLPNVTHNQVPPHGQLANTAVATIPSIRPQPLGNVSIRPAFPVASTSSLSQQAQPPPLHHQVQVAPSSSGYNSQLLTTNPNLQASPLTRPLLNQGFQPRSSGLSAIPDNMNKRTQVVNDRLDSVSRPSKLVRLNDGRSMSASVDVNTNASMPGTSQTFDTPGNLPKMEDLKSDKQVSQVQLSPEVESALLQQVLNLTPEQLSSLPPEQQQQVLQLQQMLRQPT